MNSDYPIYYGCTLIGRNRICSVSSLAKYRVILFKMAGTLFLNNRFVLVTTSCTLPEIQNDVSKDMLTCVLTSYKTCLVQQKAVASITHLLQFHSWQPLPVLLQPTIKQIRSHTHICTHTHMHTHTCTHTQFHRPLIENP